MHEYSITSSIIEIVKRNIKEKNLGPIQKINFELSPLSQIEPESVNFYFRALTAEDQYLKDTKLNFIKKKLKLNCRECKKTSGTEDYIVKCPLCGSTDIEVEQPEEIKIVSVETSD